jgi:3-hydroxyacyl-CoA dehydrogenase/enoyl-CoA hydratase/3-hydroxybutyryl-CoA epimerase
VTTTSVAAPAVRYEKDADGSSRSPLDDPDASANTMNEAYRDGMHAAVDRLYDELAADADSVAGVVVTSAKKTFFAGGNLSLMSQARPEDAPRIFAEVESMKADFRRLEKLPKPVVAAINGAALGGGFEITLACQHRILVDDPKAEVGLPEASLGLLPGAGGVTRVTRMLGIQSALMDVLLQGTRFKPTDAQKKGLVHELVATRDELVPAARQWILDHLDDSEAALSPWDRPATRCRAARPSHLPSRRSCRRSRLCSVSRPRARTTPPSERSSRPPSRAHGRHRHRPAHRVALHHRPDGRSERQEHDPGLLVRPPGDQRGQVPARKASRPSARPRSPYSAPA